MQFKLPLGTRLSFRNAINLTAKEETEMKKRLGTLLKESGLVSSAQIDEALRMQVGGNRRLGYILISMGAISEEQLLTVLSRQMEAPVITLADQVAAEVRRVLPRYLCQKYNVVPVSRGEGNILHVAMVDPSDAAAIADIEDYTGMEVRPMLARATDISAAINRFIPFSVQDLVNPQGYGRFAKVATTIALLLLIGAGWAAYRKVMNERYGTTSMVNGSTTYKNHDLMLGVEDNGTIALLGRGAYANGFFSVSFPAVKELKAFIELKRTTFSDKQAEWLFWVIDSRLTAPQEP